MHFRAGGLLQYFSKRGRFVAELKTGRLRADHARRLHIVVEMLLQDLEARAARDLPDDFGWDPCAAHSLDRPVTKGVWASRHADADLAVEAPANTLDMVPCPGLTVLVGGDEVAARVPEMSAGVLAAKSYSNAQDVVVAFFAASRPWTSDCRESMVSTFLESGPGAIIAIA